MKDGYFDKYKYNLQVVPYNAFNIGKLVNTRNDKFQMQSFSCFVRVIKQTFLHYLFVISHVIFL